MSMESERDAGAGAKPRGRPKAMADDVRRASILDAAMTTFIEKGFAKATMSDIARTAGMSKRDLYQQFEDKRQLFLDTIVSRSHLILDLPRPDDENVPLTEVLRRIFRLDLDERLAAERRALVTLVNRESLLAPELNALIYDSGAIRSRELLVEWIEREISGGRVPRVDSGRLAGMMLDVVDGVQLPKRHRKGPVDTAFQAEEILTRLSILFAGIAAGQD
ncbi:helix-turn-helix domain-containing protein [Paracoccus sp. MBLB3053]|uniref:Helix-turn-helix domain-containing protein n=1 Tax=Paracoccus aurantius TaxID=3073814 RepID=A0ABU2HXU9_9RHOB|nr:helix-turn-helix domain-containing protein [Paracoccus sp. MBLB3053]MDS9469882.1 helix-turn-helix domain-containing protein [Paracoccus sp. MBLB3053]